MTVNTAIEAEVAYRRERVSQHYRPWRRVGAERRTNNGSAGTGASAASSGRSGGSAGSAFGAPHHP